MNIIEMARQAGIRWDAESDCSEWRLRRSELENLATLVRNAALEELSEKLKQSGATLPAKQEHEGGNAVLTGVSIALVVIEEMKEPT